MKLTEINAVFVILFCTQKRSGGASTVVANGGEQIVDVQEFPDNYGDISDDIYDGYYGLNDYYDNDAPSSDLILYKLTDPSAPKCNDGTPSG